MYICEVCNRTYHGVCLKNTGCYTERQSEEVDKNDNWACPGCACLNDEQKNYRSTDKELIQITYEHTWKPEEKRDLLPTLHERTQELQAQRNEPDPPPAHSQPALVNLEKRGFDMPGKVTPGYKNRA